MNDSLNVNDIHMGAICDYHNTFVIHVLIKASMDICIHKEQIILISPYMSPFQGSLISESVWEGSH